MSEYLFAYGTLQPGRAPAEIAPLAAKLRPVGEGFVRGVLYDLGRYPGAIPDADAMGRICGTVMELPDSESLLADFDEYEGFDPLNVESSEFVRERRPVERSSGREVVCWFYRYKGSLDQANMVPGGVWPGKSRNAVP